MASLIGKRAANVAPPQKGKVYRVATTMASVTRDLPSAWKERFITIRAVGDAVQYQFGTGETLSITPDAEATGAAPTMTVNNASGASLLDGETEHVFVGQFTQFAIYGVAGGGFFELWLSEHDDSE